MARLPRPKDFSSLIEESDWWDERSIEELIEMSEPVDEDIKFVDDKVDRTNETVRKISSAVRRSQIGIRKGNFCLKIRDNGSFHLEQLV